MCKETFVNAVLLDWAVKSPTGLSSEISGEESLKALYESLMANGLSEMDSISMVNDVSMLAEKGKHPERQAYNKNGILVTFPTPAYKQNAIAKGTHFEKDPAATQSNLFGGGQQAPSQATPSVPTAPGASPMDAQQSALPPSDTTQKQTPPPQKEVPDPGTSGTPAAPPTGGSTGSTASTPAQGQLATEPLPQAATPANVSPPPAAKPTPVVQKTPHEVETEKAVIKQILNTDDTLPTVAGVGGTGITEELKILTKIAVEMNLKEAVKFLSNHL